MGARVQRIIRNNSYVEPAKDRRWGVFVYSGFHSRGELMEGGFTSREAALQKLKEYQTRSIEEVFPGVKEA